MFCFEVKVCRFRVSSQNVSETFCKMLLDFRQNVILNIRNLVKVLSELLEIPYHCRRSMTFSNNETKLRKLGEKIRGREPRFGIVSFTGPTPWVPARCLASCARARSLIDVMTPMSSTTFVCWRPTASPP